METPFNKSNQQWRLVSWSGSCGPLSSCTVLHRLRFCGFFWFIWVNWWCDHM